MHSGSKDNQDSYAGPAHTRYKEPLEPGLKLALTLLHLAHGNKYASMKFDWKVPHNAISVVVTQVCKAITDVSDQFLFVVWSLR